jgi:hypothetical protein
MKKRNPNKAANEQDASHEGAGPLAAGEQAEAHDRLRGPPFVQHETCEQQDPGG